MDIFQAIFLGIIEGLTEFLPISSTGHLIVAENLISYRDIAELFTVVIQVGAIAAVVWFYRQDIRRRISGLLKRDKRFSRFWLNLVVATIPAGVAGLLLDKVVQDLAVPFTVAITLILGGLVLLFVEARLQTRKDMPRRSLDQKGAQLDSITTKQALGVGLAQTVSLIPGVSRSGASIVGGLLSGLDRVTATAFSFYLSIPIMILASGYKLIKQRGDITSLPGGSMALILGVVAAFITALSAVSWLLRYISRHDFKIFAYYRIAFGTLILLLIATRFIR